MTFIKVEYYFEGRDSYTDNFLSYSIFTEIMQCIRFFDKLILITNNRICATNIMTYNNDDNTFAPRFETRTEVYTNHVRK